MTLEKAAKKLQAQYPERLVEIYGVSREMMDGKVVSFYHAWIGGRPTKTYSNLENLLLSEGVASEYIQNVAPGKVFVIKNFDDINHMVRMRYDELDAPETEFVG